jgi:hypothetical protein
VYFDGRDLKSYAEPVSSSELQEGQIYFSINYVDDEMLVPIIETLVFIGKNLEPGDIDDAYFQDLISYKEGVTYNWESDEGAATFYSGSMNALNHIFNYEHLINELMKCSLRRSVKNS